MTKELLKWTDEYALGIKEIDNQHKKLIDIINEIYSSFIERKEEEGIKEALRKMLEYTEYHFKTEEKYFRQFKYDKIDEHIALHNIYVEKINSFRKNLDNGNIITFTVMNFLKKWLVDHIQKKDREYVELFRAKGL